MKGKIVQFDSESHLAVRLLLPWYVIGRLNGVEVARVQAHLPDCPRCRSDVAWQRRLHLTHMAAGRLPVLGSVPSRSASIGPVPSLALRPAPLGSSAAARAALRVPAVRRGALPLRAIPWLRGALVIQCLAILGLAVLLAMPAATENLVRTLAAGNAPVARLAVVFRPTATEQEIRQALLASGARLTDGPTAAGTYLLSVAAAHRAAALERLRSAAAIVLRADPIDAGHPVAAHAPQHAPA